MPNQGATLPPQSLQAEQSVLGSILVDEFAYVRAINAGLKPEHFYREAHQIIFETFRKLSKKGPVADLVLLNEAMTKDGTIEKIGGPHYLVQMADAVGTSANLVYHIEIIIELAARREIIKVARMSGELSYNSEVRPADIALRLRQSVEWIVDGDILPGDRTEQELRIDILNLVTKRSGRFTTGWVNTQFDLKTADQRKISMKILEELVDAELIEPYGGDRTKFRTIEQESPEVEWWVEEPTHMNLRFPFKLEELISMVPGTVMLVEGEKDAGKTSFCMNFVKDNMHGEFPRDKFNYIDSENNGHEINMRIKEFVAYNDLTTEGFVSGFKLQSVDHHWHDLVDPDAVNIIDYVSDAEEFYKVIAHVNNIHKKMKGGKGIAIVCVQKHPDQNYAVGGRQLRHNPRVVVQLVADEENTYRIKIVNCKGRANPKINPLGKTLRYRFGENRRLVELSEWHYYEDKPDKRRR